MSPYFWDRVHEHITSSTYLPNINGCKYNICQAKKNNNDSSNMLKRTHLRFMLKNPDSVLSDQLMELHD